MKTLMLCLLLSAACLVGAGPGHAQEPCVITGPTTAAINQSFTLCGPSGNGYRYEWSGPGIPAGENTRCVTTRVGNSGTFEFLLILSRYDREIDRCTAVVNVGGSTGGNSSCMITGPTSVEWGRSARLCAPNDGLHTYRWTGPDGFTSANSCVTVELEGAYYLTSRNKVTGSTRQCVHHLTVTGNSPQGCDITGPTTIAEGSRAQLCGPSRSNTTYRWSGPRGTTGSARCLTVRFPGTYTLTMRNETSGRTERCSQTIDWAGNDPGDDQNPDDPILDNCPRPLQFWRTQFGSGGGGGWNNREGLSQGDLRIIARRVDERSTYFNWTNDLDGMRQALNPGRAMTRRQQLARQYAALLANVVAGELGGGPGRGTDIGLDVDTPLEAASGARTVGDLIERTDRMLSLNRGNFARLNATITNVNNGRGIGPTCE